MARGWRGPGAIPGYQPVRRRVDAAATLSYLVRGMKNLSGTVALITGASAGIGAACARAFAREGARVILAARRLDRLQAVADELADGYGAESYPLEMDVRDRGAVHHALEICLPEQWREIEILVNNAGLGRGLSPLHQGDTDDWDEMIDTNFKGLLYVTREVLPGMVKRRAGHVVNLGSIAGHEVYPGGNVYCATKHAADAVTRGLRLDLLGSGVRVSTVDPGMVDTEFSTVRFHGDQERADRVYRGMAPLTAGDVAEVVLFCVTRPRHVNVDQVIVKPADQADAVHVHRS